MNLNNNFNEYDNVVRLTKTIEKILSECKASDIMTFDIRNKSNLADYMIIASGTSDTHVRSLVRHVSDKIKYEGSVFVEGVDEGNWAVISLKNIIIHIFRPEVREYYKLEDLWK